MPTVINQTAIYKRFKLQNENFWTFSYITDERLRESSYYGAVVPIGENNCFASRRLRVQVPPASTNSIIGEKSIGEADRQIRCALPYRGHEMSNRKSVAPFGCCLYRHNSTGRVLPLQDRSWEFESLCRYLREWGVKVMHAAPGTQRRSSSLTFPTAVWMSINKTTAS